MARLAGLPACSVRAAAERNAVVGRNTSDLWTRRKGSGLRPIDLVEAPADEDERGDVDPGTAVRAGAAEVAMVHRAHQSRRRPPSRAVMPGRFAGGVTRARRLPSGRPGQSSRRDGVGAVGAITRAPQRSHVQTLKRNPRTHRCGGIKQASHLGAGRRVRQTSRRRAFPGRKRRPSEAPGLAPSPVPAYSRIDLNDTVRHDAEVASGPAGAGTTSIGEDDRRVRGPADHRLPVEAAGLGHDLFEPDHAPRHAHLRCGRCRPHPTRRQPAN